MLQKKKEKNVSSFFLVENVSSYDCKVLRKLDRPLSTVRSGKMAYR